MVNSDGMRASEPEADGPGIELGRCGGLQRALQRQQKAGPYKCPYSGLQVYRVFTSGENDHLSVRYLPFIIAYLRACKAPRSAAAPAPSAAAAGTSNSSGSSSSPGAPAIGSFVCDDKYPASPALLASLELQHQQLQLEGRSEIFISCSNDGDGRCEWTCCVMKHCHCGCGPFASGASIVIVHASRRHALIPIQSLCPAAVPTCIGPDDVLLLCSTPPSHAQSQPISTAWTSSFSRTTTWRWRTCTLWGGQWRPWSCAPSSLR